MSYQCRSSFVLVPNEALMNNKYEAHYQVFIATQVRCDWPAPSSGRHNGENFDDHLDVQVKSGLVPVGSVAILAQEF